MTSIASASQQGTGLICYAARQVGVSRVEVMRVLSTDCPTGPDFDLLVDIAAVTGADLADLIPGVDRRDRPDPRTGVVNPHVHQSEVLPASGEPGHDPRTEWGASEQDQGQVVDEDPALDPEVVELVTAIDAALDEVTTGEPVVVPVWGRMALAEEVGRLAQRTPAGAHRLVGVLEHHQVRAGALL